MIIYHIYRGFSFMGYPNITQEINTIKSTYLPLSGGVMTGNITLSKTSTKMWNFSTDKYKGFEIAVGGQHESTGASLNLYHKDSPTSPGCFFLCAADGTNKSILWASASGTLTWNGIEVATRDIPTYVAAETLTAPAVTGKLCVVKASKDNAPNNGIVLSTYTNASWWGQLFIGDNSTQGIYFRGMSDGVVGNWYRLVDENRCKAFVTATYVSGTTGYRKYSDGYIEQWGFVYPKTSASVTVTYPTAFTTTNYNIQISEHWSGNHAENIKQGSRTTSSFILNSGSGSNFGVFWRACGY